MKPLDRSQRPNSPDRPARPGGPSDVAPADWKRSLLTGGALVLLVLLAYLPIARADFAGFDDNRWIVENPTLRSWDGLRQIWFVPSASQQYYPLTVTTHWIEWRLWGVAPFGYHAVSVLLHAASAVLAWRVLLRLNVPGAWLAAAIFAVHPVCVESVAWVSERKNVLSLALALAALLCYLRFAFLDVGGAVRGASLTPAPGTLRVRGERETHEAQAAPAGESAGLAPRARWGYYFLALAFFVAALLSKTVVVTLPAVLLVLCWRQGRLSWRTARPLLPMFALSLLFGAVTAWLEATQVGAVGRDYTFTPLERALIAGRAVWFYAAKVVWPYPLVFFYPRWDIDAADPRQYLYPAGVLAVVAALWVTRWRLGRGPLAATLIYIGVLAPALGLVNLYYMQFSFVADHLQYHAMLGLIALAAAGIVMLHVGPRSPNQGNAPVAAQLPPEPLPARGGVRVTGALVLGVLTVLTMQRVTVYRDAETLYRDTLARNPDNWQARINLAGELYKTQRGAEAAQLLGEAARLRSDDVNLLNNVAALLLTNDLPVPAARFQQAIGYLAEAARLEPGYLDPRLNLGNAWLARGDAAQALPHYEIARRLAPDDSRVRYGLGMALGKSGDWRAAVPEFEAAIQLEPDSARGHYGLGIACAELGQREQAIRHLRRAAELAPRQVDVQQALDRLGASDPVKKSPD